MACDPIPGPAVWPPTVEYRRSPESTARHLAALRAVIAADPRPEPAGDGIIWVGGGKYWPGIVVGVRLLREMGCSLPVEVWYRGECEWVRPEDVTGLGVELIDADAMSAARGDSRIPRGDQWAGGWECKLYALTHTRFDRVLFLDADAYAVSDPRPLFDLLTWGRPFVFWEDLPRMVDSINWPRVLPEGDRATPTVQGGQFLIDRRHTARLLNVAHWLCQHSDYYFCWLYGDQDCWRVALAAGACAYRSLGPAEWRDVAFVCGYGGREFIVHRCQGKLFNPGEGKPRDGEASYRPALPSEGRVFDLWREVRDKPPVAAGV